MFVPIGTDAPVYFKPWATLGLIAANVLVFAITKGGTHYEAWMLEPNGLHPHEWFTAAFLHLGVLHLLGNMIFLWVFGLIVEGKLGWWKFLLLYLALCAVSGFWSQLAMLASDEPIEGAGGASGVIYALMAIALVWAPKNCIDVVLLWGFGFILRVHRFDVTIMTLALYFIGTDFLLSWFFSFAPATALFHVLGAAVGFPFGVVMLRQNWVDCEGWDLFSVLRGNPAQRAATELHADRAAAHLVSARIDAELKQPRDLSRQMRKIGRLITQGKGAMAWPLYRELRGQCPDDRLNEPLLRKLIESLRQQRQWREVLQVIDEYIERFPDRATKVKILKAGILVREFRRPKAALRALDDVTSDKLTPQDRRLVQAVLSQAQQQLNEGVIELDGLPVV